MPYYSCLSFSRISALFPIRTLLDPIHPFTRDRKCSDPKVSTFESEPKSVRIADPKVYGYAWSRVNARPIRTHIYPDSFGSDPVYTGSKYAQKCPFRVRKFVVKRLLSKLFHTISHHPCNRGRRRQLRGIGLAIRCRLNANSTS